jgi:hypothetical protein
MHSHKPTSKSSPKLAKTKNPPNKFSQKSSKKSPRTTSKISPRAFSTTASPPSDNLPLRSTVTKVRLFQSTDDVDPSFLIASVPLLSPIPFIPPHIIEQSPTNIPTADNQTELPSPHPNSPTTSVFVQHSQGKYRTIAENTTETASYAVLGTPDERNLQYHDRAKRTYIQYDENAFLTEESPQEADESFILPIITVGPSSFALMQVRHSSPRSIHLRMLGGKCFYDSLPSSVESSSISVDSQTNALYSRTLHNLTRKVNTEFSGAFLSQLATDNGLEATSTNDLIDQLTQYDPNFIDLRYNIDRPAFNTNFSTRVKPIGKPRKMLYSHKIAPNTFGRVIASQINSTSYPIDPPTQLFGDIAAFVRDPGQPLGYPAVGVPALPNKPQQTHKSMVHLVNFGKIMPDGKSPNFLDPAQVPNLPGTFLYPQLFSQYNSHPELTSLAMNLFSTSTPQMQSLIHGLTKQHLEKRYPAKTDLPTSITPSPSSHAPFIATLNALSSTSLKPGATMDDMLNELSQPHLFNFKRIFGPKMAEIENSDPRLLLWLLPMLYHFDKPGSLHSTYQGLQAEYLDFDIKDKPLLQFQSSSLHWVPLSEITNIDPYLAPRWNRNQDVPARTVTRIMNAKEHQTLIQEKYQKIRPDLVTAHQNWSNYVRGLPRIDREALALNSSGTVNSTAISEVGQLLATSTGSIYPTRQSHLDLLQTPQMNAYLKAVAKKGRDEAFAAVSGGESKMLKRIKKYPQMGRDFGYSIDELAAM